MTTTDTPKTACDLAFGTAENAATALGRAVADRLDGIPAVRALPPPTRDAATRQVSTLGGELLDLNLGGLVVAGWCRYHALVQAARATARAPGTQRVVDIVTHQVSAASHPAVELLVDDVSVVTINFDLTATFEIKALSAVIREGRLVALESGRCQTTVTIAVQGYPVASHTTEYDLRVLVQLGNGIPLTTQPQATPHH